MNNRIEISDLGLLIEELKTYFHASWRLIKDIRVFTKKGLRDLRVQGF